MDDIVSQWYEDTKNVDEMQDWNPALKEWEKTVAGHFPSGARILDIGCGLGREAFALCDLGFEVVGTFVDDMDKPKKQIPQAIILGGIFLFLILLVFLRHTDHHTRTTSVAIDGTALAT